MTEQRTIGFRRTAILVGVLAALVLSACGGSSTKSPGSSATSSGVTAPKSAGSAPDAVPTVTVPKTAPDAKAVAYRKCLEAHGAGLPKLVLGPGGSVALGHLVPPKGVSRSTYERAVKICGGAVKTVQGGGLKDFVNCMTANGIKKPPAGGPKGVYAYLREYKNPKLGPALKTCAPLLSSAGTAGK